MNSSCGSSVVIQEEYMNRDMNHALRTDVFFNFVPTGVCASNPCVNGTCTDTGNTFSCVCNYGYTKSIFQVCDVPSKYREYRSDDITKNFSLHFSVLDTMYRWSMMKNIHSPNLVGIGSWGPDDMAV